MIAFYETKQNLQELKTFPELKKIEIKPVKIAHTDGGIECIFILTSTRKGYKIFPTREDAVDALRRQKKASKHLVGPKVLSNVEKCVVVNLEEYDRTENYHLGNSRFISDFHQKMNTFGYMFQTQVVKVFGNCADEFDRLDDTKIDNLGKKLHKLGFETDDLHEGNIGFIGKRLVCIDFGTESIT